VNGRGSRNSYTASIESRGTCLCYNWASPRGFPGCPSRFWLQKRWYQSLHYSVFAKENVNDWNKRKERERSNSEEGIRLGDLRRQSQSQSRGSRHGRVAEEECRRRCGHGNQKRRRSSGRRRTQDRRCWSAPFWERIRRLRWGKGRRVKVCGGVLIEWSREEKKGREAKGEGWDPPFRY